MMESQTSRPSRSATAAISAWRICFAAQAPADARVLRRFVDPIAVVAHVEPVSVADLSSIREDSNAGDELYVVHVANPKSLPAPAVGMSWLGESDGSPLTVPLEDGRLHWRPGRALIEGYIKAPEELLPALAEFSFSEGQLRKLEGELRPFEASAPADTALAYHIRQGDKVQWSRLYRATEQLALLRLSAARMEPRAFCPPRDLPAASRRVVARLAARADIEDRLDALSARLEACEDLYEGAVDRITDHGWASKGNRLEIAIVALLILEAVLLIAELLRR
jgi:hypothetical protein